MKRELLIIDPQVDFCKPPPNKGALSVVGADKDMERLAAFVNKFGSNLDDINVTLDSHHLIDCGHTLFWINSQGQHPNPLDPISAKDIHDGVWSPIKPFLKKRMTAYADALEAGDRYPIIAWPPHCLIGSPGHAVSPVLFEALQEWEEKETAWVNYVTKGSNIYTEHYSAVKAEVPDPEDHTTQLNTVFIDKLEKCDVILVAGEALSHCVANTVRDIAAAFGDDSYVEKITLLLDCTSSVSTFENLGSEFLAEMSGRGMKTATTTDILSAAA